ncbi:MAG TPA: autotransporter domain-containing protein [Sideroxyarcus sp.]|nr:autotransporter domain-containing protein [Sideroxyarcus sp.]
MGGAPDDSVFDATFANNYFALCAGDAAAVPPVPYTCPNKTLAHYATNPANLAAAMLVVGSTTITATASGDMTASKDNATTANKEDLSAYFASLLTPVLTNPGNSTMASGAAYSYQIVSAATSDYLVSTTTYGASATGITFSVSASGLVTATLPTVAAPTNYTVTLSATNAAAATPTGSVSFTLTVNPPAPVVSSAAAASGTVGVAYTAGSPLYTITASNTPTSYSVSSGSLPTGTTLNTSTGAVTGTPTTAGSFAPTLAATNVTGSGTKVVTFTIAKANQTITFGTAPTIAVGGTGTVSATGGGSGNTVTFSVPVTTGVCSISGTTVTGLAAGTCTVVADQAGNANYNPGTQSQNITIGKANQTVTFGTAPTVVVGGTGTVSATGGGSGNAVTFSVPVTTGICSISGTTVTGLAAGTCTVVADQAGNANYNAGTQSQNITIGKGNQTITFGTAPTVVVGGTGTVSATGGASGNAVTFSVPVTTGICSISGTTVTGIAAGTCTVVASQAGNADYNAGTQSLNISVGLTAQTIGFGTAPAITYPGTGTVSATATSGLTVTLTSSTPSVCTISGNTVTSVAAGTCTIAADQAGNGTYGAATQVTQTFSISKADQSIAFGAAPTVVVGGTGDVSATGGASGNAVTFTSTTAGVCTIAGRTVTGVATGTCTIAANQAGDGNYNAAAQVTQSFSVGQGSQTISFDPAPTIVVGGNGTVSATSSAGLAVTYSSTTTTVCTVSGNTVTAVAAGTCTIAANQAGNANYAAATQVTQSFAIGQSGQTISFGAAPTLAVGGSATVSASATSGLGVVFTSTTTGVCTVSGNTVTGVATGTCTIAANQSGNSNYTAAPQVTQSFAIGIGSQTISFGAAPSISVGGTGTVTATATSGLAVALSSNTPAVCTISGNTVTGVSAGNCIIAADQAGNANYAAATQVTQSITVSNLPPSVVAATMTATLNTAATLDMTGFITGPSSGITIFAQPAHGTVSASGMKVTYTPKQDYFGTDTFSYKAYNNAGMASAAATVTVTITGRPDPLKDARVTGLVNIETATVKRFGKAQIFNFQQRLESRHHAAYGGSPLTSGGGSGASSGAGGGAVPGETRGYFNSWQPGTMLAYANDPAVLLNAPDRLADGQVADPLAGLVASLMTNALTSSSLNLATLSNAVGGAQEDSFGRLEVWAAGNLRFGTRSQAGVDTRFSTDGISIGMDKRMDRKLTVGMGMGYARDKSSIGTDGTNSTSSGSSLALYASYQMDSGTFVDGLLGYGMVNFDTNRYIASVNDFARAYRSGDQLFGSFSFGYDYRKQGLLWSPYGRYDFSLDRLDAGVESGAGANALSYAGQTSRNSQLALGMRVESVHQASFGVVQPHARVEYQRGFESSGQTSVAYADLLGTQYTVAATSQNTNSLVLGLGSQFLLSDTLRLALDYQRLRSGGRENYQSVNFRLTKDLEGKNDLQALLVESYASSINKPSGLMVAAGFAYDDNVSRASAVLDKLSDTIYSLTVNKAKSFNLTPHTRLTVSGFLDIEKFRTYAGLGHVSAGMQGEYLYRVSGEFGSPTYGIFARYTADEYESALRDGSRRSAGVTLRKPLTDRINLFAALAENVRAGKSAVFDTRDVSARMNLDYALATDKTVYLTGEYRKGDIVSSGQPSLQILDMSYVFVRDDVFNSPWFYDYRMQGKTTLFTLGYNLSFGAKDSMDFAWRHVRSTPDRSPSYAAPIRYFDNHFSISYLMAF